MKDVTLLTLDEAREWFFELPIERQIATLSPDYVVMDAVRDLSLEPVFLGYREGDLFWMHGVHKGRVEEANCWDFQSPYGYGGPVTNSNDDSFLNRAWRSYTTWCRNNDIMAEFIRLHPLANDWQPYGGEIRFNRVTIAVSLVPNDITIDYSKRCKRSIAKARKVNPETKLLPKQEIRKSFPDFYRKAMKALGADDYYLFSDSYFDSLADLGNSQLMVSMVNDEWLSASVLLMGAETVEYHLGASTEVGKKVAMSSLTHHESACLAKLENKNVYYLGGGSDRSESNSLLHFKSGFSEQRYKFFYGYMIYNHEIYKTLKNNYLHMASNKDRVLFYR